MYAVFGSDDFLRSAGVETVLGRLLGDDREGGALTSFEGPSAELADVLDACRTPSLFAARQVVCVLDADDFVKEHRKSLERYLEDVAAAVGESGGQASPNAALLLVCRTWQKTTRLYKLVDQVGVNVGCEPPRRRDGFVAWVREHGRNTYGCQVAPAAADRLVELVGENLGLLNMELAKVSTYVADRGDHRPGLLVGLVAIRQPDVEQVNLEVASAFVATVIVGRAGAEHSLRLRRRQWHAACDDPQAVASRCLSQEVLNWPITVLLSVFCLVAAVFGHQREIFGQDG